MWWSCLKLNWKNPWKRAVPQPIPPQERPETPRLLKPASQTGSQFLCKLPPELRLQIYDLLLGGRRLHFRLLTRQSRTEYQTRYYLCTHYDSDPRVPLFWDHFCWRFRRPPFKRFIPEPLQLSILLTCRQVYAEAIDVFYTTTIFSFDDIDTFTRTCNIIPCQRWNQITKLEVFWRLSVGDEPIYSTTAKTSYDKIWHVIASMQGLRILHIAIKDACPVELLNRSDYAEHAWLSSLEELHRLEMITIYLHAPVFFRLGFESRMEEGNRMIRPMWIYDGLCTLGSHLVDY